MCILILFCAIPMLYVGQNLLSVRSVFELYPLLFLPLFAYSDIERKKLWLLIPGSVFVIFGVLFQRLSLVWIGSFWNALSVLHLSGITFTWPAPFLVFAIPPITGFGSLFLGYRLRLIVTEWSAWLIRWIDPNTTAVGNQIFYGGEWFTVDRVCEGMKMGLASVLIAAAFALRANRTGKILIACLILPLWFFSNLIRVCILVLFQIPANSWKHEFVGLVFFICGVITPLVTIALIFSNPSQKQTSTFRDITLYSPPKIAWLLLLLLMTSVLLGNHLLPFKQHSWPSKILSFQLDADSILSDSRIAVYRSRENYLILKRDLFAIGTGHDPRICFEAVGFSFVEQEEQKGFKRAQLSSPSGAKPILLWWYSVDENKNTTAVELANISAFAPQRANSDLEWRWKRFRGADVIQWNLYGPDETELRNIAETLSKKQ
ncbi:exosortase N [Leptospira sp. WS92.C1]